MPVLFGVFHFTLANPDVFKKWVVATLFLGSKLEHGPKLEMKQQQKHGEPEMEENFSTKVKKYPLGDLPQKRMPTIVESWLKHLDMHGEYPKIRPRKCRKNHDSTSRFNQLGSLPKLVTFPKNKKSKHDP